MEKPRIFISYRREDTAPYAGRIYDRLVTQFGVEQVFFDIDTIPPGDDFVEVLSEKVESCDVLLAVIGRLWLTIADAAGRPRIQNPEDFVAIEIGAALRRKVRVIPILVGGGRMPGTAELPEALAVLARRQAHELPDKGFIAALDKLFPVLQTSRNAMAAPSAPTAVKGRELYEAGRQIAKEQADLFDGRGTKKINPKDGLTYIWIPPGTFMMGCSPGDTECSEREKPAHPVEITRGFWIGETPVTQEAYQRVMGSNPSTFKGPQCPVEQVSWEDATRYCEAVGMRLPTEAEWEYAARAGSSEARYGPLDEIAWHAGNSGRRTHNVKGKLPNAWGLYDTLGNVMEWVADWYEKAAYSRADERDPQGPREGDQRGVRGGSWYNYDLVVWNSSDARVSDRGGAGPAKRHNFIGFRCAGNSVLPGFKGKPAEQNL